MKKIYKIAVIFCIIVAILLISTVINAYYTSKKYIEKEVIFGYNEIERCDFHDAFRIIQTMLILQAVGSGPAEKEAM